MPASWARPSWPRSCTSAWTASSSCTAASRSSPLEQRPPRPRAGTPSASPRRASASPAGIRPERFARLVTLASVLIEAGRAGRRLHVADVCERLQISPQELREDVSVLNVVNFGGGAYVLYAEVLPTGEIEVDPEPYSDTFDRPARLLPIEARALLAAIELLGVHLSEDLLSARARSSSARSATSPRRACSSPTRAPTTRSPARSARRSRRGGWSSSSTTRPTRTASPPASWSRTR